MQNGLLLFDQRPAPSGGAGPVPETLDFILGFEGIIPGAEFSRECGNYLDHDLEGAKKIAADMKDVLKDWTVELMDYDVHM